MVLVHEGQADGSLILQWYVNAAIYEKETAEDWIDSLEGWARFLAGNERLPHTLRPALLPEEERRLADWEHGEVFPHPLPNLPAQFEHWARTQPDRPALIAEAGAQSFAVVNARANALAHALLARGMVRQEVVGVLTGRSLTLPEIALAIWKAGGCYLALAEDLPADRLAFMARDAGVRILVALDGLIVPTALAEADCQVLRPESLSAEASSPATSIRRPSPVAASSGSEPAYMIYTSGSTGSTERGDAAPPGMNNLGVGMAAAMDIRSGTGA